MSFPPRPPIMPGIMVPPFTYPPINMMPIGMMPVPGMMRPGLPMSTLPQMNLPRPPSFGKPEVIAPPVLNKPPEEKQPVTTVFVGNIHDKAPDAMIKLMLQKCGNVLSWKRVQGASGKLQAFGFCEYDNPASTLRCIRLLNDWNIVDKKLLVKVDAKTNDLLEEYKKKRDERRKVGKSKEKEEGEENSEEDDGEDSELRRDVDIKEQLEAIVKDHNSDLHKNADGFDETDKRSSKGKKSEEMPPLNLEGMELEEDIKNLVNREIRSFRDAHLNSDSSRDKDKEKDRERDVRRRRDDDRTRERDLERERREREREREKERARERDKERERDRDREREKNKSPPKAPRDRSPVGDKRSRDREAFDVDEEEELYERKKLERKLREKEAAYQELLRKWESRERKKTREYEREKQREKERRSEENKESKRLREFLEDYNDERDDVKYYKGSALQRRVHERAKEFEADERDRRREREELEEIRRKLQEQGHPDLESEMARIEREREGHLLPRIPIPGQGSPDRSDSPVIVLDPDNDVHNNVTSDSPRCFPSSYFYNSGNNDDDAEPTETGPFSSALRSVNSAPKVPDTLDGHDPVDLVSPAADEEGSSSSPANNNSDSNQTSTTAGRVDNSFGYFSDDSRGPRTMHATDDFGHGKSKINVELPNKSKTQEGSPLRKSLGDKRKRSGVADIFNADDDDEESNVAAKKRRLTLLDMNDDEKSSSVQSLGGASGTSAPSTAEEKRKWIKSFIEKIPTKKKELFAWKVNWSLVDQDLVDKRIKPWINKKIVEYIGEDEPTLTEFICKKVTSHTPPDTILSDISMVLDEEAEVFVMKMWRLLIYEIEAKKHGVR